MKRPFKSLIPGFFYSQKKAANFSGLKNIQKKKLLQLLFFALLVVAFFACEKESVNSSSATDEKDTADTTVAYEDSSDYVWDTSQVVTITLNYTSIATTNSEKVTINGSIATIVSSGTYRISGTLTNGQIIVNPEDTGIVRLILNGVNVTCSTSAPLFIKKLEKAIILLADNTENYFTDGTNYVFESTDDNEPNAAIFSKSYLAIYGNGTLNVDANYNDGITGKDGLLIKSGNISVTAVDDGIRGKDYLVVNDGSITLNVGGDGLKSDNEDDATLGYIAISDGVFNITSSGDAISAQTNVHIYNGEFTLISGGGSSKTVSSTTSAKGIKASNGITIDEGTYSISTADDAIHSDGSLTINGGNYTIASKTEGLQAGTNITIVSGDLTLTCGGGSSSSSSESGKGIKATSSITIEGGTTSVNSADDALHSDGTLSISGGTVTLASGDDGVHAETSITISNVALTITKSYEGIESKTITINSGNVSVTASNDAINASAGTVSGGTESNDGSYLYINGGIVYTNCTNGDGLDSNGNIQITGGTIVVHGPSSSPELGMDYNGTCNVSGGTLIASGPNSGNMIEAISTSSSQYGVKIIFSSQLSSSTYFHIQDASGIEIVTFKPLRSTYYIVFSSPDLKKGSTYYIYKGGTYSGGTTVAEGYYEGGSYSGGTQYTNFTISSIVTSIGSSSSNGPGGK
jgi:hypothetical protein